VPISASWWPTTPAYTYCMRPCTDVISLRSATAFPVIIIIYTRYSSRLSTLHMRIRVSLCPTILRCWHCDLHTTHTKKIYWVQYTQGWRATSTWLVQLKGLFFLQSNETVRWVSAYVAHDAYNMPGKQARDEIRYYYFFWDFYIFFLVNEQSSDDLIS
jgi:hypothetical protein